MTRKVGIANPSSPNKRLHVRIPNSDNIVLIALNKLTIIGRVTNPLTQSTRAVLSFLTQMWNLEGRFQMRFHSEEDLERVLNKDSYHYKKWMLILQCWEPVVSKSFPSIITNETVTIIGEDLGVLKYKDLGVAKIRVELPTDVFITVEFKYMKLENIEGDCLMTSRRDPPAKDRRL
ncbi:hypothetical protein N665_0040s0054 [Sinapis alba]|nr:hypothetical protein N665_0040s0054 [Sinapis alba]